MSDAIDKALDQITEAEALAFISALREYLATANAALVSTQSSLSEANQATSNAEAKVASLTAELGAAQVGTSATVATSATVVPSKVDVILHQVNGNRLLTVLSTDAPESGTLTVHVS